MAERTIFRCLADVSTGVVADPKDKLSPPSGQPPELGPAEAIIACGLNDETATPTCDGRVPTPWWSAVEKIAAMMVTEGLDMDNDQAIRKELCAHGFSHEAIEQALDWVGGVILSGQSNATLSMLVPSEDKVRIEHPLEEASIPLSLRRSLLKCMRKGLMTRDYAEKILEGFRNIEARDWSQREVTVFLFDALSPTLPWLDHGMLESILSGVSNGEIFN
jgi:uncharacterized protein Smg (DUF494 family)